MGMAHGFIAQARHMIFSYVTPGVAVFSLAGTGNPATTKTGAGFDEMGEFREDFL
jgi:hypothetical protein